MLAAGDDAILIATGSEVPIALEAREQRPLLSARVVSMPCVEWFEAQDEAYRREVLPPTIRARVSVEAGITPPWRLFTGEAGASIGVDHFGASAAYQKIYQEFGITAERVAAAARDSLARVSEPAPGRAGRERTVTVDVLGQLSEAGVSVWLDDISRDRLRTGNLQSLIDDYHVVGVTFEPDDLRQGARGPGAALRRPGAGPRGSAASRGRGVRRLAAATSAGLRRAPLGLRRRTDGGGDGRVSIEVDPRVPRETGSTLAEAREPWWMVDRPNALYQDPGHPGGCPRSRRPRRGDQRQRHA